MNSVRLGGVRHSCRFGSTKEAPQARSPVPPSEPLGQRAKRDAADDRADVVADGDQANFMRREAMLHLHEDRIKTLRAVAEEVECGHQKNRIDAESPMRFEHAQRVAAPATSAKHRRRWRRHWSTSGCDECARSQFTELQIPRYAGR